MSRSGGSDLAHDLLDRAPAAIEAAREETAGAPQALVDTVTNQLGRLQSEQ